MDTATSLQLQSINSRRNPSVATPSPPESCMSNISEHSSDPPKSTTQVTMAETATRSSHHNGASHDSLPSNSKNNPMVDTSSDDENNHRDDRADASASPPTVAPTISSCTTAFPSLPPLESNGSGGALTQQQLKGKRPTRDRVLRKLSDALMRRSLTMVSFDIIEFFFLRRKLPWMLCNTQSL